MKRKSRELSIFSMSALDLFASALGAFILISVVMFPYFPNTGTAEFLERVATAGGGATVRAGGSMTANLLLSLL